MSEGSVGPDPERSGQLHDRQPNDEQAMERLDALRWAEDYTAQLRSQGWSDERIADLFLEAGWSREDLALLALAPSCPTPRSRHDPPVLRGCSVLGGAVGALLGGIDILISFAMAHELSAKSRLSPLRRGLLVIIIVLGLYGISLLLQFTAPR